MEVSVIGDRVSSVAKIKAQSAAKFLYDRQSVFQISAIIRPVDTVAKPRVKSHNVKTARRRVLTKRGRTKRISRTEGGGPDDGILFDGFFGGDGPYGGTGGGGGGGGRGWGGGGGGDNSGFGGFNWDESSSSSPADPAFDIVYEVLCWIVFSNCLHFAFKKIIRSMTNGIAEPSVREKVPLRLTPVC